MCDESERDGGRKEEMEEERKREEEISRDCMRVKSKRKTISEEKKSEAIISFSKRMMCDNGYKQLTAFHTGSFVSVFSPVE